MSEKWKGLGVNDPRKIFADERLRGRCVFCGAKPDTKDHCPSKTLLDEPYPADLRVVLACLKCNNSFSLDEQYLACFLECAICGSTNPDEVTRDSVKQTLREQPKLVASIAASLSLSPDGTKIWKPDMDRVRNVVVKLARGHLDYELCLQEWRDPDVFEITPMPLMTPDQLEFFENPDPGPATLWPEIGSRAFLRMLPSGDKINDDWQDIQDGRYRYLVGQTQGNFVHIAISEYLACRVTWE